MANGKTETKTTGPAGQKPAAAAPAAAPPAAATAPAGGAPATQTAKLRYVDRPELAETFADSINALFFDGQMLRIEFGVSRFDEMKPNTPLSGRRLPACRLVLPATAAVELINRMQQVAAALTQAGVVKQNPPAAAEPTKTR